MIPVPDYEEAAWYRRVGARLKAHWRLKLVASVLMAIGFFSTYFVVLHFPVFQVTEVPATVIDRLVGFWSTSLLAYITLWIYVPLGSWLLDDRPELVAYSKALAGLGVVGLAVFFLWPTAVPRPAIDVEQYPSFRLLVAIDEPRNVFPCLHAAFAVFSAACIGRPLRQLGDRGLIRALAWCWCLGILYSALATKQHMTIDLSFGAVLGAAWAVLYVRSSVERRDTLDREVGIGTDRALRSSPVGGRRTLGDRTRDRRDSGYRERATQNSTRNELATHVNER